MGFHRIHADPVFAQFECAISAVSNNMNSAHIMQAAQCLRDFGKAIVFRIDNDDNARVTSRLFECINIGHTAVDEHNFHGPWCGLCRRDRCLGNCLGEFGCSIGRGFARCSGLASI